MKYIMCAKTFPAYHPKAGQPTGFRQSILHGAKVHTLRQSAGNRKSGEIVSLREWEGRPYCSKQVEFARCWIEVDHIRVEGTGKQAHVRSIADRDGFTDVRDFVHWFTRGKDTPIDFDGVCIWFRDVKPVGHDLRERDAGTETGDDNV